jgi:hypothetical protein
LASQTGAPFRFGGLQVREKSYRDVFVRQLEGVWLPAFCAARGPDYQVQGFVRSGTDKLSEFDAYWFLRSVNAQYVSESGGFFANALFASKEQIFSSGSKGVVPRALTLWLEPIITIGAIARLIEQFGFPPDRVGAQSAYPWPFDLAVYKADGSSFALAGEVKKSRLELMHLITQMTEFGAEPQLAEEPQNQVARNSYRKVVGMRKLRPPVFWALGPEGIGHAFKIEWKDDDLFRMVEVPEASMLTFG